MAIIRKHLKNYQIGIILCVVAIMVITVLEFPAPVGFETRPQNNVSAGWLFLFLTIVVTEIATLLFIFIKPETGKKLGMVVGGLNVLQVAADQLHLMQPEIATQFYSILEYAVAIFSLVLVYFSYKVKIDN